MELDAYHLALKSAFASEYAFLIKAQNFHWNVLGRMFYADHLLFERIYEEVQAAIDAFAENLRKVGVLVPAGLTEISELSIISDAPTQSSAPEAMIALLYSDSENMINLFKVLYKSAEEQQDYNLANFFADRQDAHAQHCWMLRSIMP